jgi:hypothetical protein
MTSIVLVEHNGNIKNIKSKDFSFETLYKKCGFRSAEHFDKMTTWSIEYNKEICNIELWAKNEGKANNENKYDFPPPVDNDLYYGTCALVRVDSKGKVIDLTADLWVKLYEKLFGGFEDIVEDDEEEEDDADADEDDEDDDIKTKNGYIKDDFVVDDDEEEEDEECDEEDDENKVITKGKKKANVIEKEEEEEEDYYGSELEEEAYSYSDED